MATAAGWTKELDLQLVRILREYNGGTWEANKGRNIDWQRLFERGSWPPTFTSSTLNVRWADTYRRWHLPGGVARDKGNRALQVNFDHLEALIEGHHSLTTGVPTLHGKRKDSAALMEAGAPSPPPPKSLISASSDSEDLQQQRASKSMRLTVQEPLTLAVGYVAAQPLQLSVPEERSVADWLSVAAFAESRGNWLVRLARPATDEMELETFLSFINSSAPLSPQDRLFFARALVPTWLPLVLTQDGTSGEPPPAPTPRTSFLRVSSQGESRQVIAVCYSDNPVAPRLRVWDILSSTEQAAALSLSADIKALRSDNIAQSSTIVASEELDYMLLFVTAMVAAHWQATLDMVQGDIFSLWPGRQVASRWLLSQVLQQRRSSLHMLPSPPLVRLVHNNLLDALAVLGVRVPVWLERFWRVAPDSTQARNDLADALRDVSTPATQLVVAQFAGRESQPRIQQSYTFWWQERERSLCLVAERDRLFAAVLRIAVLGEHIVVQCALQDDAFQLRVDGVSVPFPQQHPAQQAPRELRLAPTVTRLDARFSGDDGRCLRVTVMLTDEQQKTTNSIAAGASLPEPEPLPLPIHATDSSSAMERLDNALLSRLGLQRHVVSNGDHCMLRAILAALHQESQDGTLKRLHTRIWELARQSQFRCDALPLDQQQALASEYAPHLVAATTDSGLNAVTNFWKVAYIWAAPVIEHDILLLTDDARKCTVYPCAPALVAAEFTIPITDVPRRLLSRAASIVLVRKNGHHDWASLILQRSVNPSALVVVPAPSPSANSNSDQNARELLEAALTGQAVDILQSLRTSANDNDYWWESADALAASFRSAVGKVVWYRRDNIEPAVWHQQPLGLVPQVCSPLGVESTVEHYLVWHQSASRVSPDALTDLYCLVDVPIPGPLLTQLFETVPFLTSLSDRFSPYSILSYLRRRFSTTSDREPRLHITPSIVPHGGSISLRLHRENEVRFRSAYHWFLGFSNGDTDAAPLSNLIDVYACNKERSSEQNNSAAPCGEMPIRRLHLKPGELLLLPAGQAHSFSAQMPLPMRGRGLAPNVSVLGDVAWLGRTLQESTSNLGRMLSREENLGKARVAMLACLNAYDSNMSDQRDDIHRNHVTAMLDSLRGAITKEAQLFESLPLALRQSSPCVIDRDELWSCQRCDTVILNTVVWRRNDETFCLECFCENSPSSFRLSDESHELSFHFGRPTDLLATFRRVSQAVTTSAPQPCEVESAPPPFLPQPIPSVMNTVNDAIRCQRQHSTHDLCRQVLAALNIPLLGGDKERMLLLRLAQDFPRFCHAREAEVACPLRDEPDFFEQFFRENHRLRARCHVGGKVKCNKLAELERPLHECANDFHQRGNFTFHLDCSGYHVGTIPYGISVLCAECIELLRGARSTVVYRELHLWEQVSAPAELDAAGFRIIPIPKDGLCFFTVLYMLISGTTAPLPSPQTVLDWMLRQVKPLLREALQDSTDVGASQQVLGDELGAWDKRTLGQWQRDWDSEQLDYVCSLLPKLLTDKGLLRSTYHRYSFDSSTKRGAWFNEHACRTTPPPGDLCVFLTETPVAHYSLLERCGAKNLMGLVHDQLGEYVCLAWRYLPT